MPKPAVYQSSSAHFGLGIIAHNTRGLVEETLKLLICRIPSSMHQSSSENYSIAKCLLGIWVGRTQLLQT